MTTVYNSTDGGSRYEDLGAVPDMNTVMRRIVTGMVPVVGTRHVADKDPSSRLEVRGVRVDPSDLAAYATATGLRLSNELPPTYPFVIGFPLTMELMSRADFPFAPTGAVHVANVIEQKRALRVDESFTFRTRGERLRPHRKGLLIDIVTDVFVEGETDNEPVWTQRATMLAQGAKFAKSAPVSLTTRGQDDARMLDRPEVPDIAANAQWTWTRDNVRAYVKASGDSNPIHTSALGAKAFGFPGVIAHGMFSAAAVLQLLEGTLGGALRYSVEFHKPVVVPARVSAWALDQGERTTGIELRNASKPEKLHLNAQVEHLA
ncbi:MaoC like domain protein [Corynebacterium capitovis DSM 44611]|uniref:MaoC/PaaZ C-terminal domain-containing protein n=1 Tax=Corynebacterium capitovis TaxID=131081 RepID=UPI00036DA762|nr:MaoC/PaaZ C-terminal domain-containing protein [Corynebacterium capitovis]WKD57318.1 MaoC like domain protein [Corynebacterium capitovis DSM 44611]